MYSDCVKITWGIHNDSRLNRRRQCRLPRGVELLALLPPEMQAYIPIALHIESLYTSDCYALLFDVTPAAAVGTGVAAATGLSR